MDSKQLEFSIEQAQIISELARSRGWGLLREWIQAGCDLHREDVLSFQFVNDHEGYLTALANYNAYNNILKFIDGTINRGVEAQKELEKLNDESK